MKNLLKVLKSKIWLFGLILGIVIIAIPSYYFTNFETIKICFEFNCMKYHSYIWEIVLTILIMILFWLFLASTLYKIKYFSIKKSWIWFFAWLLWLLVAGCPACTITLASYFGLSSIISVLPFGWIELKIISVFMLLYVVYITIRDLEVCKIKKIKKWIKK